MRIAMFTNTYLPHIGGVARSVSTYENVLRNRGNDIAIVAPEFPGAEESTDEILRVPAIQNFNGSDFSVRIPQPWLISDRMEQFHPELIHSHHPFLLGDSALRTAHGRRLPLVFTHHTMYEQYSHYVPLDSDALKRVAIQLATEYCNLCTHVIAPSESIEELLRHRGVAVPITTIPTGIDLSFFGSGDAARFRTSCHIDYDAIVVGHVGRLADEKNLRFLATAVGLYLENNPEAISLIVGDGPARISMEEIFTQHGVQNRVVFAGVRSGQDLADAYAAIDVFAFSSQSETQGMVVAEALAAACPVVALDGPGVREVMNDSNGRMLSADASVGEFAAALTELTEDPNRLWRIGELARESVHAYGLDCCADKLTSLYESLIEEFGSWGGQELDPWDQFQGRLEAEWMLLTEKASALVAAVVETDATKAMLV